MEKEDVIGFWTMFSGGLVGAVSIFGFNSIVMKLIGLIIGIILFLFFKKKYESSDAHNKSKKDDIRVDNIIKEDIQTVKNIKVNGPTTEDRVESIDVNDEYQENILADELKELIYNIESNKIDIPSFKTIVTGITKNNDKGKNIQKLIKEYVEENYDFDNFDYYTNQEIKDFVDETYQYELFETDTVSLVDEPDNEYDPNAIKIVHEEMGHIGYIPAKDVKRIKCFISKYPKHSMSIELRGGKMKYVTINDNYNEVVRTRTNPYYLDLYIEAYKNQ